MVQAPDRPTGWWQRLRQLPRRLAGLPRRLGPVNTVLTVVGLVSLFLFVWLGTGRIMLATAGLIVCLGLMGQIALAGRMRGHGPPGPPPKESDDGPPGPK